MHEVLLSDTKAVLIQFKDVRFLVFKVICYINAKSNQAEIRTSYALCSLYVVMTARNSLLPAPTTKYQHIVNTVYT
jgi:hypothetical protein